MDKNKANVPKIRFPGFTDPWEQRKLGDITEKIGSGKTPKGGNATYKSEGVQLIRSQNIFDDKVNNIDIAYISEEVDDEMKNSRVYKNDVLLNITGASIGRSAVYKQDVTANVNQHVCILRPFNDYSSEFIQLNLSSDKGQKEIELNQAGGGREGLNFQQIAKMNFFYPDLEEQKYIVSFFEKLNSTITLHQRKLNHLQDKKKSLLQKMFPKKGENFPELRFPGFTDSWEQRKLGDLVKIKGRIGFRGYTQADIITKEEGGVLAFSPTNIVDNTLMLGVNNTYITRAKYEESPEIMIENGNILFVKTGSTLGKSALVRDLDEDSTVNPQIVILTASKESQKIISTLLTSDLVQEQVTRAKIGGAVPTLTETEIKKFQLSLPVDVVEQKKIGNFFQDINDLITLHQRKLNHLQEQKKALLQQMFI